jgi:hypothetical protein
MPEFRSEFDELQVGIVLVDLACNEGGHNLMHRVEVQIDHQMAGDGFHVLRGFVQPGGDGVFVDVLDPRGGSNTVAFAQTSDHIVEGLFIC